MLIEKEIISPGNYWYTDEATGLPRKLEVTPELTKYWQQQGSAMLSAGLTVPVPFEHDFNAHPMTPKDKLLNNAGWVKEYRLKDNRLFGVVDILDDAIAKKLPTTIRWTSPWINSFSDGQGKQWNNVISHLALTTRPRITKQQPFPSIAAALSMATPVLVPVPEMALPSGGLCLSRAGRLLTRKKDGRHRPKYPIAFSMFSGAAFGDDDAAFPPKKKDAAPPKGGEPDADGFEDTGAEGMEDGGAGGSTDGATPPGGGDDSMIDLEPFNDPAGDVSMEELLCDLLGALGIFCEKGGNEQAFKRSLYTAAMQKINELTTKAQSDGSPQPGELTQPGQQPGAPPAAGGANPLIQQEQQPMYMSLEEINKLPDPMRTVALSMYAENQKLRAAVDASTKVTNGLRDAKLKDATAVRAGRVALLGRISPKLKADLEAMVGNPSMALSMGDGGAVNDPMQTTLMMLEKGLSDVPRLLTADAASLSVQPQPTDSEMSDEEADRLADSMARMMGCAPDTKKAS